MIIWASIAVAVLVSVLLVGAMLAFRSSKKNRLGLPMYVGSKKIQALGDEHDFAAQYAGYPSPSFSPVLMRDAHRDSSHV
jgi:hypothetical protein